MHATFYNDVNAWSTSTTKVVWTRQGMLQI